MISKRHMIALALAGTTFIGAACSSDSKSSTSTVTETSADTDESTSAPDTTEPDTTEPDTTEPDTTADSAPETSTPTADGDFSVAAGLRQIPANVLDSDDSGEPRNIQIAASDLDAATELAGVERAPSGTTDVDELAEWLLAINGPARDDKRPVVAALFPEAAQYERFADVAEIIDEVGWSISDVHSFVEYQVPPNWFTVMTGSFSADSLTEALGEPSDNIWRIGGEDFSIDRENISSARPLGEALRFSLHDDQLAVARATPTIEAWAPGLDEADSLAEDEGLLAVATALDEADVYSALLTVTDFSGSSGDRPPPTIVDPAEVPGLGPFTTLGIGLTVDDGTPIAVFTYAYPDAEGPANAVEPLTTLIEEGTSARNERPWSDAFAIRDITADGNVLVATLELKDFLPGAVWGILFARENLTQGSP